MKAVIADMRATAQAHEQWADSPEATASEAATACVFATTIRAWLQELLKADEATNGASIPEPDNQVTPKAPSGEARSSVSQSEKIPSGCLGTMASGGSKNKSTPSVGELLAALKLVTDGMDQAGGDGYGMPECPWCRIRGARDEHTADCELRMAREVIASAEGKNGDQ